MNLDAVTRVEEGENFVLNVFFLMELTGSQVEFQYFKWEDRYDGMVEIPLGNKELILPLMKVDIGRAVPPQKKKW